MRNAGYSAAQELDRVYENTAPDYKLYVRWKDFSTLAQLTQMAEEYEIVRDKLAGCSAGITVNHFSFGADVRTRSRISQVEDRPGNSFADPPNFLREIGTGGGVPAAAKTEVTNRMMTQTGGSSFNPRKVCHRCAQ